MRISVDYRLWLFSLSIYLSICLYTNLSIYLSIYLSVCISIYPFIYLKYMFVCLSVCLSVYISIYISIYLSIWLSNYLSIIIFIYPSLYLNYLGLPNCMYVHFMSVCLSVCISVYDSLFLSIYLFLGQLILGRSQDEHACTNISKFSISLGVFFLGGGGNNMEITMCIPTLFTNISEEKYPPTSPKLKLKIILSCILGVWEAARYMASWQFVSALKICQFCRELKSHLCPL